VEGRKSTCNLVQLDKKDLKKGFKGSVGRYCAPEGCARYKTTSMILSCGKGKGEETGGPPDLRQVHWARDRGAEGRAGRITISGEKMLKSV